MGKKSEKVEGKVLKFIKNVREYDNGWSVSAMKMQWGDDVPTMNIRRCNIDKGIFGSGIAISDTETDILVDALLSEGYGSVEAIEDALNKRKNMFDWNEEKLQELRN